MKYLITAFVLLLSICGNAQTKPVFICSGLDRGGTEVTNPVYKIRDFQIRIARTDYNRYGWDTIMYTIQFTDDNWKGYQHIREVRDSTLSRGYISVMWTDALFGSYEDALNFTKQFRKYTDCFVYNYKSRQRYKSLLEFYEKFPPKKSN